jgi:hypothetical protein
VKSRHDLLQRLFFDVMPLSHHMMFVTQRDQVIQDVITTLTALIQVMGLQTARTTILINQSIKTDAVSSQRSARGGLVNFPFCGLRKTCQGSALFSLLQLSSASPE